MNDGLNNVDHEAFEAVNDIAKFLDYKFANVNCMEP